MEFLVSPVRADSHSFPVVMFELKKFKSNLFMSSFACEKKKRCKQKLINSNCGGLHVIGDYLFIGIIITLKIFDLVTFKWFFSCVPYFKHWKPSSFGLLLVVVLDGRALVNPLWSRIVASRDPRRRTPHPW